MKISESDRRTRIFLHPIGTVSSLNDQRISTIEPWIMRKERFSFRRNEYGKKNLAEEGMNLLIPSTITAPSLSFKSLYIHHYSLSLIHISEPTRLLSISYAVFCLQKK